MARRAEVERRTGETDVRVELAVEGSGASEVRTGIGFLDHMLNTLARHGLFDLTVEASGDLEVDEHHTVEDVAIVLGRAFNEALGERRGIRRMGHAVVPMDEALALVAVDCGGRGQAFVEAPFTYSRIGDLGADLVSHFIETLAREARLTIHARLLAGENDHHRAEAIFKALARAMDDATSLDPRRADVIPSTKGTLE
ncbi:MAG: imidazoleglycerol-phosphate dehydratase HisB [Chloroflexi bacterium]|nr:imidazoleglycerol-phosphate dehydratase HisB [Chloroflexota bacterium]